MRPYRSRLTRSLLASIKRVPGAFGWWRTRWRWQPLALALRARRGVQVARETGRRWLHAPGSGWQRARHVARAEAAERVTKLTRSRHIVEPLRRSEVLFFIAELAIQLLPKIGYAWLLKGTQTEVLTPGTNRQQYLAGALDYLPGQITHVVAARKTRCLVSDRLGRLARQCPTATKLDRGADHDRMHKAKPVEAWLKQQPRFELVWWPSYCPKANPIERAFGVVPDQCTRNHKRTQLAELVSEVTWQLKRNGPWRYKLSRRYYESEVDAALAELNTVQHLKAA